MHSKHVDTVEKGVCQKEDIFSRRFRFSPGLSNTVVVGRSLIINHTQSEVEKVLHKGDGLRHVAVSDIRG